MTAERHQVFFFFLAALYGNMRPAAMRLADGIHLYLTEFLLICTDDVFNAFPRLGAAVHSQVSNPAYTLSLPVLNQ